MTHQGPNNDAVAGAAAPGQKSSPRMVFVDALRGIAACAVAAYHIRDESYSELAAPCAEALPEWVNFVLGKGWMGVQVFFVISGFVIAYSLRKAWLTPFYLANYAFRRSLRLDPPYWATILLVMGLHFALAPWLQIPSSIGQSPSCLQTAAHLAYLQNIFDLGNLSVGFWTLCIEVQFYLLYCVLLGIAQRFSPAAWTGEGRGGGTALVALFAPLGLVALGLYGHEEESISALSDGALVRRVAALWLSDDGVLCFFWMFFLGMLVHWTLEGRTKPAVLWAYFGLMVLRLALHWRLEIAVAGLAGLSIYLAGLWGKLGTWLRWPWLQHLGRISYSLYLVHYPVAHVVLSLGHRATGSQPYWALFWVVLAWVLSVVAGTLMYYAIERPSLTWAARFRPADSRA